MERRRIFMLGLAVLVVLAALTIRANLALAHNAGHIHLPTGECVDVGSGNHTAEPEHQDKIDGPGDQYGARWAAEQDGTPIYPRHCDEPGAHNHP